MAPTFLKAPKMSPAESLTRKVLSDKPARILTNLVYSSDWEDPLQMGLYSFNPEPPFDMEMHVDSLGDRINSGSGIQDGILYFLSTDFTYLSESEDYVYTGLSAFDTETWQRISGPDRLDKSQWNLVAKETAQDNITGTIYGEFFTSDLQSLEWGTIDYETRTRTTIGPATHEYVALGVTSDGILYGIAKDGNLYKVNMNNGAETFVGSTGIVLTQKDGSVWAQGGEIDQKDNTFYWASVDSAGHSQMYTVNLQDASLTSLGDFEHDEQMEALLVEAPLANADAPGKPENLAIDFDGGNTTGTVTFTAPDTTFSGEPLTGELDYSIASGKKELASGKVNAGESVTTNITAPEGSNIIYVTLTNEAGTSPKAKQTIWVGYDVPKAPENVSLAVDGKNATISWAAPTEGLHGNSLDAITYNVYRIVKGDTTKIANGITETLCTDNLAGLPLSSVVYGVVAVSHGYNSPEALSNKRVAGDAFNTPYFEDFISQEAFDLFTVIDANDDGITWKYDKDNHLVKSGDFSEEQMNDWLITPPIKLKAGREYKLVFKTPSEGFGDQTMEVSLGTDNSAEGMSTSLLSDIEISYGSDENHETSFSVNSDGEYYIGFHDISEEYSDYIYLDSISLSTDAQSTSPDQVNNIKITPDATGKLNAHVAFTAPQKTIGGDDLQEISTIEVRRNGINVKTFNSPKAGASLEFDDRNTKQGNNTYTFVPYLNDEAGKVVSASAYIGLDAPQAPDAHLTDGATSVSIDWQPVTEGLNGGLMFADSVTYSVYPVLSGGYIDSYNPVVSKTKATHASVSMNTDEGAQQFLQYGMQAYTSGGNSPIVASSPLVIGKPNELPVIEGFVSNQAKTFWWAQSSNSQSDYFGYTNELSADNDGYSCAYIPSANGSWASLNSGKLNLKGAKNPRLVFSHWFLVNSGLTLDVNVIKPDGTTENVETINASEYNSQEWGTTIVDLSNYVNERYIFVSLKATSNSSTRNAVDIDNFVVADMPANDIAVKASAPESVMKGQSFNVKAKVINHGEETTGSLNVKLYNGENLIDSAKLSKELMAYQSDSVTFNVATSSLSKTESMKLRAVVDLDGDVNPDDNSASLSVALVDNGYNPVQNLNAENGESNKVHLTWSAPDPTTRDIVEDFESYSPWSIDNLGDWKTYDGDKARAADFLNGVTTPHSMESYAYMVFNPENVGYDLTDEANSELVPHSGNQYIGSVYGWNSDWATSDNDNWLISPRLDGNAQTVTFYARSYMDSKPAHYVVYSSKKGTDVADFDSITDGMAPAEWTKVSVDVPEGAIYFAIRENTKADNAFIFMLDDISYRMGVGAPTAYNIYCDGELIGSTGKLEFDVEPGENGNHTFSVTAVYKDGSESAPAVVTFTTTGIEEILSGSQNAFNVFTVDGIRVAHNVKSLNGLKQGVYVVNNKKVIVK